MKNTLFFFVFMECLFCYSPADWLQNLSNQFIKKDFGLHLKYEVINGKELAGEKELNLFYHNLDSMVIETETRKIVTQLNTWSVYDKKSNQIFIDIPDQNLKKDISNIIDIIIERKYSIKKILNSKMDLVVQKYNIPISISMNGQNSIMVTAQFKDMKMTINNMSIYKNNFNKASELPSNLNVIDFTK